MANHRVFTIPLDERPVGTEVAYVALGCFWGAEKLYWQIHGVRNTAVGYMGGDVADPSYELVCTGTTGHAETVRVTFDPTMVSYQRLLQIFFENHDPTQGNRQGNDIGSQYRSVIFTDSPDQERVAQEMFSRCAERFDLAGYPALTTAIVPATEFWLAEPYHQQYLVANPGGYCPIHATGVCLS